MAGNLVKVRVKIEGPEGYNSSLIEGSVIRITVHGEDTIDSANISIYTPNSTLDIDTASMTKLTNNTYEYLYQTIDNELTGTYYVTIRAIKGSYTSLVQRTFELEEQEPENAA